MPIFQDDFGGGRSTPPGQPTDSPGFNTPLERRAIARKLSDESIRTELCEGLVPDSPQIEPTAVEQHEPSKIPGLGTSDRGELIERLKRGEISTWVPSRNV